MTDLLFSLALIASIAGVVSWAIVRVVADTIRPGWPWRNAVLRTLALAIGASCGGALHGAPLAILTGASAGALCTFVVWAVKAWVRARVKP